MSARTFALSSGCPVTIGAKDPALLRLHDTCFRGVGKPFAGNFVRWNSFFQMLDDKAFVERFLTTLESEIPQLNGNRAHHHYFSVLCDRIVGWSSTAPRDNFGAEELERFAPNNHCTGLRVRANAGRVAPLTCEVTFSADFIKLSSGWSLVIYTVYPGPNIGPLGDPNSRGSTVDITARSGQVFFSWSHIGEPLR